MPSKEGEGEDKHSHAHGLPVRNAITKGCEMKLTVNGMKNIIVVWKYLIYSSFVESISSTSERFIIPDFRFFISLNLFDKPLLELIINHAAENVFYHLIIVPKEWQYI